MKYTGRCQDSLKPTAKLAGLGGERALEVAAEVRRRMDKRGLQLLPGGVPHNTSRNCHSYRAR
jgi:hypothetical protein